MVDQGRKRQGRKRWQREVEKSVERLIQVLKPSDVVLGGGNAKKLTPLPPGTRLGDNSFAFLGGFRMWEQQVVRSQSPFPNEYGRGHHNAVDIQHGRRKPGSSKSHKQ
jgi:hypothetical protein